MPEVRNVILTLNAGSSSLKYALFAGKRIAEGKIDGLGANYGHVLDRVLDWAMEHTGGLPLAAVGHRIVHGGDFIGPARLDDAVMAKLAALCPLAPLHQPHNLAAVTALAKLRPELPQIGCFDTAFHHSMGDTARRFALPRRFEASGLKRYGFHGLSYEYIAGKVAEISPKDATGRIIVAHLGSGASLCALKGGHSIDTSMSFTPLDGLMMGTRCGSLDPGVVLYLIQALGMDADAVQDLLYNQSGLLGVSGVSADMRVLLSSAAPAAEEAIDLFVYRINREAGALIASLGGFDGIVFTGGIGENAPAIREAVALRMTWQGLTLDPLANRAGEIAISAKGSVVKAWCIPTDEEAVIARQTRSLAG